MKIDHAKIDIENLDELIGLCEDKMASPFKKKQKEKEEPEKEEPKESKIDLSDMDKDELLEMYSNIKGSSDV